MNYSVYFFDGKQRREWSFTAPANCGLHPERIFFECVYSILFFNKCAIVFPKLYERIYRSGWNAPPDYELAYNLYARLINGGGDVEA